MNRQPFVKYTPVYPRKHYWSGFDEKGVRKWYIELSNGRIVSSKDENYFFWLKKHTANEKQSFHKQHSMVKYQQKQIPDEPEK
jgi:hypothetical protein